MTTNDLLNARACSRCLSLAQLVRSQLHAFPILQRATLSLLFMLHRRSIVNVMISTVTNTMVGHVVAVARSDDICGSYCRTNLNTKKLTVGSLRHSKEG